jgi:hypothetical protein
VNFGWLVMHVEAAGVSVVHMSGSSVEGLVLRGTAEVEASLETWIAREFCYCATDSWNGLDACAKQWHQRRTPQLVT